MSLYAFTIPGKQPEGSPDAPVAKGDFVVVSLRRGKAQPRIRPALVRSVYRNGWARSLWMDRAHSADAACVFKTTLPASTFERVQHDEWDSVKDAREALEMLPAPKPVAPWVDVDHENGIRCRYAFRVF